MQPVLHEVGRTWVPEGACEGCDQEGSERFVVIVPNLLTVARIDAGPQRTSQSVRMLRLGNHLRLTGREVERFTRITGIEPVGVKSLDDLDDYIGRCKDYYQGASQEARFLRWLLDEERSRCLCAA